MSSVSVTRFNWLPMPSAWQAAQTWHAKQQAARADLEDSSSSASSAFFGASNDYATGMATIAAKIAANRLKQPASTTIKLA